MHEKSRSNLMAYNRHTRAYVLLKSTSSHWLYPFTTSLALFLKIFPSSSTLSRKIHLVLITWLAEALGTSSRTLFLSNWFDSSCIIRDQCSMMKDSSISFGSILETKAIKLHTFLKEYQVVNPLKISPVTCWIEWSLAALHYLGISRCYPFAYSSWRSSIWLFFPYLDLFHDLHFSLYIQETFSPWYLHNQ